MLKLEGMDASCCLYTQNVSSYANQTGLSRSKIYVFLPLSSSTKLTLLIFSVTVGILAFFGNVLILCFVKSNQSAASFLKSCSFRKNFDVYISSLAISDALCAFIVLPLTGCQLFVDVFERGWGCKILRYLGIFFPSVTINNLLIIIFGKYFSTRKIPRTLKHSTVKKLLYLIWFSTCVYVLLPVATMEGIRYDLNDTHYTVVCRPNHQYVSFGVVNLAFIAFQYFLPSIVIFTLTICLILTVRSRMKRAIDIQCDNAIKIMKRAENRRLTMILVSIMLMFIFSYALSLGYFIFRISTRSKVHTISFESDFLIRYVGALLAFSNSLVNVIIYLVQMKDFRRFLKSKITSNFWHKNLVVDFKGM